MKRSSLIICGPSGVGKGTLIQKLLADYPSSMGLSVSHTSRKARVNEVDGFHYYFEQKENMIKEIERGAFLEYAEVHGNLYGTKQDSVDNIHNQGKVCILDLDRKGVLSLKEKKIPNSKFVFITSPSFEALEERLRKRNTESHEQIARRLQNAKSEIAFGETPGNFDLVLINDHIDSSYAKLVGYCKLWFQF
eukprot:gene3983-5706_t